MSVQTVKQGFRDFYSAIGKRGLNALFPEDIELYVFAFELLDYRWETIEYFILPVTPGSIEETKPKSTSVTKTASGVVSLRNPTFMPTDISISGTFGRSFKLLLGDSLIDLDAVRTSLRPEGDREKTGSQIKKAALSTRVKTGYGCIKVMERIFDRSTDTDDGKPRTLVFYNLASGNNYIVDPQSIKFSQNEDSRQIFFYSMNMASLTKIENVTDKSIQDVTQQVSFDQMVQGYGNRVLNAARRALR